MGKKTVVVVDDSPSIRSHIALVLGVAGFETVQAKDGLEGIARVRDTPDVSLVLCDLNMPRMNGIQLLQALAGISRAPVVLMTTEGNPQEVERAKQAGAREWLVKPLEEATLVRVAQRLAGCVG